MRCATDGGIALRLLRGPVSPLLKHEGKGIALVKHKAGKCDQKQGLRCRRCGILIATTDTGWDNGPVYELPGKRFIIDSDHYFVTEDYKEKSLLHIDSAYNLEDGSLRITRPQGIRSWTVPFIDCTPGYKTTVMPI